MKKCKCEHWQTCPVCYPQGFDEAGNRKLVEIPPTRGEMLARIKELEAERDALAMQNHQMRSALLKLATLGNGEQYGNSIGNCIAQEALALPDTSEIIKRHDAAVLRKAAEHLHAKARAYLNEFDRRVAHDMASALEKSCPPSN